MWLLILLIGIYLKMPWWFWAVYIVLVLAQIEKRRNDK